MFIAVENRSHNQKIAFVALKKVFLIRLDAGGQRQCSHETSSLNFFTAETTELCRDYLKYDFSAFSANSAVNS
jgi:hypothetical protein